MNRIRTEILGLKELQGLVESLPLVIERQIQLRLAGDSIRWEQKVIESAIEIVYAAYAPLHYKRRIVRGQPALVAAVAFDYKKISGGAEVIIFNQSDAVPGTVPRKSGVPKEQVPIEIEEGTYSDPWFGFTGARPYMESALNVIEEELMVDLDRIVDRALA